MTRDSVTGAAQVQRDAFREFFSELETSVKAAYSGGRIVETAVDALRPVAEKLGLPALTARLGMEPPSQLPLGSSGTASSSTFSTQDVGVEPEPELRAYDEEVILPDRSPLASPGTAPSSVI